MSKARLAISLLIVVLFAAACAGATTPTVTPQPTASPAPTEEPTAEVIEAEATEEAAEVEATPEVVEVEATAEAAEVEATPEVAEVEATPEVAEVEATAEAAEVEATPEVVVAEATEEAAAVEATPEVVEVEATPEVAEVEATPEVVEVEATPEVAEVEATPEVVEVEATPEVAEVVVEVATYSAEFSFEYPEDWSLSTGRGLVRLEKGDAAVVVVGPASYRAILGTLTFENQSDELAFYLERSGYTAAESLALDGALASIAVELPRRGQSGFALLQDLNYGRVGVVIALNGAETSAEAAANIVAASLVFPPNIVDLAGSLDDYSTLTSAVEAAGLVDTLAGGEFTVFAPDNAAFNAALESLGIAAEDLLADTETLTSILTYHVVAGRLSAEDLLALDGQELETVQGATLSVAVVDGVVTLNGNVTVVTATPLEASNGLIYGIDAVLLPPQPEAEVTPEPEVEAEATPEATTEPETSEAEEVELTVPTSNIVETAISNPDFSTLVAAVVSADLAGTLSGEGPFTVFAPTNDAFAAALQALGLTADQLLSNTETLTSILTYHVVSGAMSAEDLLAMGGQELTTVQGAVLKVSVVDGAVVLNDSINVVTADLIATNGVIHVIDAVLLPPTE